MYFYILYQRERSAGDAEFGEFFRHLDTRELVIHLKDGMNDVSKNDLRGCEAKLYSQAQAQSQSLVVIHAP